MSITCDIEEKSGNMCQESDLEDIIRQVYDIPIESYTNTLDYGNDTWLAQELDYMDNFTKKALCKVAEYYKIATKRLSKSDIIAAIMHFEFDPINRDIVEARHRAWKALETLRGDHRMQKYLLLDVV
tara:strand:+ start:103 stop:483 length:381 start_codon:yes stop_codon:yes gene_type:complete